MIDKENLTDIITIIIASSVTLSGLIYSYLYPEIQVLILTMLMVLLPLIYQVGNIISKGYVKEYMIGGALEEEAEIKKQEEEIKKEVKEIIKEFEKENKKLEKEITKLNNKNLKGDGVGRIKF